MSTVTVCAVNDIVQVSYFQAIAATVLQILAPCGPSQRLLQHAFRILDKSLLAEKLRPGFLHTLTHFTFFLTSHTDCPSSTVSPSSFIPPPALEAPTPFACLGPSLPFCRRRSAGGQLPPCL